MKYFLIPLFILLTSCSTTQRIPPAERVEIEVYKKTKDYVYNTPSTEYYTRIKSQGNDFIIIDEIFKKANNARAVELKEEIWAVSVYGQTFYNMHYSHDYANSGVFAKFNIEGKINVMFIDEMTSGTIKKAGFKNFGISAGGVYAMKNIGKIGKNWQDTTGKKGKLLVQNTDIDYLVKIGYANAVSKLLTKKNFNEILNTEYTEEEIDRFLLEDVLTIIEGLNNKK